MSHKVCQWSLIASAIFGSMNICLAQNHFPFFEPVEPARSLQVVQDGGLHQLAPANSAEAVLACAEDFIEWAAVDVRRTKDGFHVIASDEQLSELSSKHKSVNEATLAELLQLDVGASFAERYRGLQFKTVPEMLELARGRVNLQLECAGVSPEQLACEILSAKMQRQVVVTGSNDFLTELRDLKQADQIARLHTFRLPTEIQQTGSVASEAFFEHAPAIVEIPADQLTRELCASFQRLGVKVQCNLIGSEVDQPAQRRRLLATGVDLIKTNDAVGVRFADARFRIRKFPVGIAFHRGASRYAPENTIAAIEQAVALEADFVELDVRTTSDDRYVLMHDRSVERTSGQVGLVAELNGEKLTEIDVGSWFGRNYRSERVPLLSAGLSALGDSTQLYLDAKDISPEAIVEHVRQHNLISRHVVYQSLDYCRRLIELFPEARTLPPLRSADGLEQVLAIKPFGVDSAWDALSPELVERCHLANVQVFSDALGKYENVDDYRQAIEWGIDVIQTDFPLRLLRAIELHALQTSAPPTDFSPRIIAHRGGVVNETLIENNLPAIAESIRRGYDMLEVDIRESLDEHLVVHHDADFVRFYKDERRLADLTWEQIQQIKTSTGERPIDFAEFASACRGRIRLMLDVKGPDHSEEFFHELESILRSNGLFDSTMVIGTDQAKEYFLGKALVGVNYQKLLSAQEAGETVAERYFLFEHGEDLDEAKVDKANELGVTIVPSINIFHYDGDGNHWLLARRDVRRLKAQGVEYFQIDSVYEDFVNHAPTDLAERPRMNELQVIGTHNSYHLAMPHSTLSLLEKQSRRLAESLDYSHLPLTEQLEALGMRQLELDIFADPDGGKYSQPKARSLVAAAGMDPGPEHDPTGLLKQPGLKVLHVQDIDYQTRALTFIAALREVRDWSQSHSWHAPVLILVEAKDAPIGNEFTIPVKFDDELLQSIDKEIVSVFSDEELITPDSVRGEFETLREAVLTRGWPELENVRGKVMFALDNSGDLRDRYLGDSHALQGRKMFVSVEETHPAAAFRKINDPVANFEEIRSAVRKGLIVRTRADADTRESRSNDTRRRELALASGAQFISTDYPVADQRYSSYRVTLPGGVTARPNPINSPNISPSRDLDN